MKVLYEVMADKTGYGTDMISQEMNLETDLGVVKDELIVKVTDLDVLGRTKTVGDASAAGYDTDSTREEMNLETDLVTDAESVDAMKVMYDPMADKTGYDTDVTDVGIDSPLTGVEILDAVEDEAVRGETVDDEKAEAATKMQAHFRGRQQGRNKADELAQKKAKVAQMREDGKKRRDAAMDQKRETLRMIRDQAAADKKKRMEAMAAGAEAEMNDKYERAQKQRVDQREGVANARANVFDFNQRIGNQMREARSNTCRVSRTNEDSIG